jgi:hypothetical protein
VSADQPATDSAMVCKRCGNPVRPAFGGTWTHRPIPGASPRDYRHRIIAIPAN